MSAAAPEIGVWATGASPKHHTCGDVIVLNLSGNNCTYPFFCDISYFNHDLLEASLPGTAVRGVLGLEPSVLQKCLWACNAFPQGVKSMK